MRSGASSAIQGHALGDPSRALCNRVTPRAPSSHTPRTAQSNFPQERLAMVRSWQEEVNARSRVRAASRWVDQGEGEGEGQGLG